MIKPRGSRLLQHKPLAGGVAAGESGAETTVKLAAAGEVLLEQAFPLNRSAGRRPAPGWQVKRCRTAARNLHPALVPMLFKQLIGTIQILAGIGAQCGTKYGAECSTGQLARAGTEVGPGKAAENAAREFTDLLFWSQLRLGTSRQGKQQRQNGDGLQVHLYFSIGEVNKNAQLFGGIIERFCSKFNWLSVGTT